MKKTLVAVAAALAALTLAPAAFAAPGNDDFANAAPLTVAGAGGDIAGATAQSGEPAHAGVAANHSVWFTWTAPADELVWVLDCTPALPTFSSVIGVYTDGPAPGTSVSDLTPVDSSATYAGSCTWPNQSLVQFQATAGTTYYVALDSANGATGTFELQLDENVTHAVIDSGPTGGTADNTPSFAIHSEPTAGQIYCGLATLDEAQNEGIELTDCGASPTTYTTKPLSKGSWILGAIAVDADGAFDLNGTFRQFKVTRSPAPPDRKAPKTKITKHPHGKTKKRQAMVAFKASESGSSFECSLNRKPFRSCTSPVKVKSAKGSNVFAVRATDSVGNTETKPAKSKWTYGRTKKHKRHGKRRHDHHARRGGTLLAAPTLAAPPVIVLRYPGL